ncbi:MAG: E3 binding domain-containing protein, partial [Gammaproteobacteria bacterium]|nr:E3 binding domain-containing protein [Gammaproteobacteria bacterium]
MSIEIKVPVLPESVADAVVANWYKQVGDSIGVDEVLVDLETDKVILEVPSVKQGVVQELLFSVGDTVTAGQLLAIIDDSAKQEAGENTAVETAAGSKQSAAEVPAMSPSVRKLMAENAIDASKLVGSGKNGRIIKQDVEQYIAKNSAPAESREASSHEM